jgi:hypothetical protein
MPPIVEPFFFRALVAEYGHELGAVSVAVMHVFQAAQWSMLTLTGL